MGRYKPNEPTNTFKPSGPSGFKYPVADSPKAAKGSFETSITPCGEKNVAVLDLPKDRELPGKCGFVSIKTYQT